MVNKKYLIFFFLLIYLILNIKYVIIKLFKNIFTIKVFQCFKKIDSTDDNNKTTSKIDRV